MIESITKPQTVPEEILSAQAVSRKLDVNYVKVSVLMQTGMIKPDFVSDGKRFFRLERLSELRRIVGPGRNIF